MGMVIHLYYSPLFDAAVDATIMATTTIVVIPTSRYYSIFDIIQVK